MPERSTWRIAASATSHRPSAHGPRMPASSYAATAAFRQPARTVSTTIDGVPIRCDIDDPDVFRECERRAE